MSNLENVKEPIVYGLDIGTRNVVGTVGYKEKDRFVVVAQVTKAHETRAMIDGQIHDIVAVGRTIAEVTRELEDKLSRKLESVCIAAAGRVLKTVTTTAEQEFEDDKLVTAEDILALEALAVEHAYEQFHKENDTDMKFYCVGYSVMHYYMNHYPMSNLLDHKAKNISLELIATFLPDDVVDGLYRAVDHAGLTVANLTLEPIAAIEVAIPVMFRMLNIALIDVGAGTSDLCITKEGSIIAYGMLPIAGDGLTELIARHCLVDFDTAESIKISIEKNEIAEYKDIMGLPKTIKREEVLELLAPQIERMADEAAGKLLELNGGKPVSAVFVVGGGGKIAGYTERIAEKLEIPGERCAVRGEDVMQRIDFMDKDTVKDSLLITPIGICLNFYQKNNNFIFVTFNNARVRLYDNNKLTVIDAAIQADFPNDGLFPKRGKSVTVSFEGKQRVFRGQSGEAAVITVNGASADIHSVIRSNDVIEVVESTAGADASVELGRLLESDAQITVMIDGQRVTFPKCASVNGEIQTSLYELQDGDRIEILGYYTIRQITEFMDVTLDPNEDVYVNNEIADEDTKVYDNFSVSWTLAEVGMSESYEDEEEPDAELQLAKASDIPDLPSADKESLKEAAGAPEDRTPGGIPALPQEAEPGNGAAVPAVNAAPKGGSNMPQDATPESGSEAGRTVLVTVNQQKVILTGKSDYIYVDVFDHIDFDLSKPKGSAVILKLNGADAAYTDMLKTGDILDIYWEK